MPSAEGTKRLEQGTIFTAHLQSGMLNALFVFWTQDWPSITLS